MSEVIIDGVNVAECDMKCINSDCGLYYAEVYNTSDKLKYGFKCESNPDCHYKQLQRAKEENQEQVESIKKLIKYYTSENTKLDRKHEKLKESTKLLKKNYKTCYTWLNETAGDLVAVENASPVEVVKITDKKYNVEGGCGEYLIEDKPTYKEIVLKLKEQIRNDIIRYENDTYDTNDFICTMRDYLRMIERKSNG